MKRSPFPAPSPAPFSGRNDFPRVRAAEQPLQGSIHENVVVEPDIQVRCFTYEDAGVLVPAHWHHSLEILLIDAGSMEVTLNDTRLSLHAQDFVLINSRDLHSTNCPEHSRICVLQIPSPFLKRNIPEYDRLRFRSGPCGSDMTDAAFRRLLSGLQQCRETKAGTTRKPGANSRHADADREAAQQTVCLPGSSGLRHADPELSSGLILHFKSLLYELLSLCVTSYLLPESEQSCGPDDTERSRLIAITDYVNAHYSEPISLQDAAAVVALNPEYFCRFFKKNMGITFLEYVSQVRFSHVCQDILHSGQSVTDILARHGFSNYKLFRRMFRETYGCTPSAKRREISLSN